MSKFLTEYDQPLPPLPPPPPLPSRNHPEYRRRKKILLENERKARDKAARAIQARYRKNKTRKAKEADGPPSFTPPPPTMRPSVAELRKRFEKNKGGRRTRKRRRKRRRKRKGRRKTKKRRKRRKRKTRRKR